LVNNDLLTTAYRPGVPSQVMRRLVLSTATVPDALAVFRAHAPVGGRAYLLGDQAGRLATVEIAAEQRQPEIIRHTQAAAHTNHALTEAVRKWESRRLIDRCYPSTFDRYARATELVAACDGTTDGIRAILADHESYPLSICRHPSEAEPTV